MSYLLLKYDNTRLDQTKDRNIVASFRVLFSLKYLHFCMLNKLHTFKVHNRSSYVQLQKQRLMRYYSFALTHLETDHHCFSDQGNQSHTTCFFKINFNIHSVDKIKNNTKRRIVMVTFCVSAWFFMYENTNCIG